MSLKRLTVGTWAVALLVALGGSKASAQSSLDGGQGWAPSRSTWERRAIRPQNDYATAASATQVIESDDAVIPPPRSYASEGRGYARPSAARGSAPGRPMDYRRVSAEERLDPIASDPRGPATEVIAPGEVVEPDIGYDYGGGRATHGRGCGCGYGDVAACGDGCDDCCVGGCFGQGVLGYVARNIAVFAGVQGFKGPIDLGRNGNFGVHEGFNLGAPLGSEWDIGYQVGFLAAQSNFTGDQTYIARRGDRHQYFFTAGVFKRAPCGGWQWGFAYDNQSDSYYANFDLKQIRQETSYLFADGNEIGYFGIYGLDGATFVASAQNALYFDPTDMYALFIRRHFELGGEGRIWAGVSGYGDGLIGADLRVPLGRSWAIEQSLNILIPKDGKSGIGQQQESWGMAMHLVWYPGRSAACEGENCFRPLLTVADNSTFMVTARRRN